MKFLTLFLAKSKDEQLKKKGMYLSMMFLIHVADQKNEKVNQWYRISHLMFIETWSRVHEVNVLSSLLLFLFGNFCIENNDKNNGNVSVVSWYGESRRGRIQLVNCRLALSDTVS